jgi:protein-ribulosamine 3-kinase
MHTILEIIQKKLSAQYRKNIEIESYSPIGGGCINHASRLVTSAGTYFLKWNSTCARDVFIREAESLRELAKADNPYLRIPGVVWVNTPDTSPGFILLEYLDPAPAGIADTQNLGRGLATIHGLTAEKFGFYHNTYCGDTIQDNRWHSNWIDFFGQQRIWHLITLIRQKRGMERNALKIYEKLVVKLPDLIPPNSKPVLIHGDLWSGNYLFTQKGPALIDPASYYADREMEMGIMTLFGGFSQAFWDGYNEINPLPADWKERNLLYQIYHILNHDLIFGGGYGLRALTAARSYL